MERSKNKIVGFFRCIDDNGWEYTRRLLRLKVFRLLNKRLPIARAWIYSRFLDAQKSFDDYRSMCVPKSKLKLQRYEYRKALPPDKYREELLRWWRGNVKLPLDLDHPKTYNDKIQWFKLYGANSLITRLVDKYEVREWVEEKIGGEYLVPLLGVWDRAEDIDFDSLPERFVLKATHGCGWNIIVTDKSAIDYDKVKRSLDGWLAINWAYWGSMEMQYKDIRPRIIAEEYMENADGDINDYKFWCFRGKCHYIQFLTERKKGLKMAFFDREWNRMPFVYDYPRFNGRVERPSNLAEMVKLAEKLADGFQHVRVDFYRLNDGTIRFGEMTFTSATGQCHWDPPEWNERLGNLFDVGKGE